MTAPGKPNQPTSLRAMWCVNYWRLTTIPNHSGEMPEGTLRALLKQAEVDPDDFLKA